MKPEAETKIRQFFEQYPQKKFSKGQTLLLAGQNPTHACFLVRGRVKQYDITHTGSEIIINIFNPSSYFMILTAYTGQPNSYYFSAETDSLLYCAPVADTLAFVNNNPDVMKAMLIQASMGFEGLLRRMTHLMSGNARGRVIYEILLDARGFGEMPPTAPHTLSINVTELSARAGLSRETVSREVSRLKKLGLLAPSRKIVVPSLSLLDKALEDEF